MANVVLKDSPAEPLLPQKLFTEPDLVSLLPSIFAVIYVSLFALHIHITVMTLSRALCEKFLYPCYNMLCDLIML